MSPDDIDTDLGATVTAIDDAPSLHAEEVEEVEEVQEYTLPADRLTKTSAASLKDEDVAIELNDGIYHDLGMTLDLSDPDDAAAWARWASEGAKLDRIETGHQWWRGDWIIAGESRFGEEAYGYFDDEAYDEKTLNQFVRVAVAFPKTKDRRSDLSWTHHKSVTSLPTLRQRKSVLSKAAKEGWSDAELRAYVRTLKTDDEAEPTETTKTREHFRISFEVDATRETDGAKVRDAMLRSAQTKAKALGVELHNLEANPSPVPDDE